jgi:hypothetical protein
LIASKREARSNWMIIAAAAAAAVVCLFVLFCFLR